MRKALLIAVSMIGLAAFVFAAPCVQAQSTSGSSAVRDAQGLSANAPDNFSVTGGKAEAVEYQGRKAIRLTTLPSSEQVLALLKGAQFQDGVIEVDIALKLTTPPGVRMPGFVGMAFRARGDASHYELFYLRPGNSRSEDQAMHNHAVQYVSVPDFDWYQLRREWPSVYESWADLQFERWAKVRIEVHGRVGKLFVNGSEVPSVTVNGLKGEDLQGGIGLWGYAGEEAYFSNVKITPATPEPVTNGGEIAGSWVVDFASDYGRFKGTMELHREGNAVKGSWSGSFGKDLPVTGTWRNGYVELTFNGTWPEKSAPATSTLAGWVDGDAAQGRMKVEGRADGQWHAQRQK